MARSGQRKERHKFHYGIYEMVNDPSSDSIISWSKSYKSFVIRNQQELIRTKMLSGFSCSNLTEFISKLKVNGFKEIKGPCGLWEFGNKNFVRGRPELLEEMHANAIMHRIRARIKATKANEQVKDLVQNLRI